MARKKKTERVGRMSLKINGHDLYGEWKDGGWQWACPSWPPLAREHSGEDDCAPMLEAFMQAALSRLPDLRSLPPESK